MFAPKWTRALRIKISPFSLKRLSHQGIGLSTRIYMPCRHQTALVYVHAPSGLLRLSFLAAGDSPPLSDEDLHLLHFFANVEIIFAHILLLRVCHRDAA